MRRAIDIVASAAFLAIAAPLLALIALAVWLDSGAPILFRQTRAGRGLRPFTLLKFRTMRVRRSESAGKIDPLAPAGHSDITRAGAFLRATKLDELPQLWNILRGEMSIIGPRPEVFDFVNRHREAFAKLLIVKPGLVDPASIAYFDEGAILAEYDDPVVAYEREILPHKLKLSADYVEQRNAARDLGLIASAVKLCTRKLFAYGS